MVHVRAERLADRPDQGDVLLGVEPDLELEGAIAGLEGVPRRGGELFGRGDEEVADDLDLRAVGPAPEPVQRLAHDLARRVPHGHLGRGERRDRGPLVVVVACAQDVPVEPLDVEDGAALDQRKHRLLQHRGDVVQEADALAIALDPRGRRQLDDQPGDPGARAGGPEDRRLEGDAHHPVSMGGHPGAVLRLDAAGQDLARVLLADGHGRSSLEMRCVVSASNR